MGKILTNNVTENMLVARCLGSDAELKDCFGLMIDNRLAPINFSGNYMRYHSRQIIDSKGYEQMIKQKGIIENIIPLSEIDSSVVEEFVKKNPTQEYYIKSDKLNKDATMIFMIKGVVAAVMYVCTYDNHDVFCASCYIHPKANYEVAIPFLAVSMVERTQSLLGELNDVYMCPSFVAGKSGFKNLFGEPEYEIQVHDYSIIYRESADGDKIKEAIEKYNQGTKREDVLYDYLDREEFSWVSAAAAARISYAVDLRKLPDTLLKQYRNEVFTWLNKWDIGSDVWKKIVFECGKSKGTINSMLVEELKNQRCIEIYKKAFASKVIPQFDKLDLKPEDILIRLFPNDSEEIFDFMPEHIRKVLGEKEMVILGALTPGHEVIGVCVLDIAGVKDDVAYFKFAYVIKEFENLGIYELFIKYAVAYAKRIGCTFMYSKSMAGVEGKGIYDCEKLLRSCVDIQEEDKSYILVYRLEQLINVDLRKYLKDDVNVKIVTAGEVNEEQLKILRKRAWKEHGVYFDPENYDEEYTFFVDDYTTLNAAAFATQISDTELFLRDVYVASSLRIDNVAASLVSAVLKKARKNMDINSFILIKTDKEENIGLMEQIFGKALVMVAEKEVFGEIAETDSDIDTYGLLMPEDVSIERAFCEKLRLMIALYNELKGVDMFCSLLLDRCSDYPGNKICKYIRDNYLIQK